MDIIDELMDTLNEKGSKLFESNRVPYIITKANHYLTVGPETYRSKDAFGGKSDKFEEDLSSAFICILHFPHK